MKQGVGAGAGRSHRRRIVQVSGASFHVEALERLECASRTLEHARADPGLVQSLRDVVPRKPVAPVTRIVVIARFSPRRSASWIINGAARLERSAERPACSECPPQSFIAVGPCGSLDMISTSTSMT